ncbi:MAG: type II secretion system protein GspM [Thermodesulfobacteriota bacterium]
MNKLFEYISGLEEREKNILLAGVVFLILFIIIRFGIIPVYNYKKDLENRINSYIYQAEQIKKLGAEYKKLTGTGRHDFSSESDNNPALFSFMDSMAGKTGIKDKIDYMKPSSEEHDDYTLDKVEVKVSNIDMKTLVSFLYELESGLANMNIKALKIVRSEKGGSVTSTIKAETVKSHG